MGTNCSWEKYNQLQRQTKKEIEDAKFLFEEKLAERINEDPKSFYAYVRSKQKIRDTVGPLRDENGKEIKEVKEMVEMLNQEFVKVFTEEDEILPIIEQEHKLTEEEKLVDIKITEEMTLKKLKELDKSKAQGPDKIHPRVLVELAEALANPLTLIYQKSIDEGTVPQDWKISNVTPLFKKGKKSDPLNYRPINITSVPGKVLEKILRDKLTEHLEKYGLIADTQHGFRRGRSCTTNLLEFWDYVTGQIDKGVPVDAIYLDLRKAFDTVPHKRLLLKLHAYGIEGKILEWIKDWLRNRKQKVVVQGIESSCLPVTSSVVQGSVLGPLCFTVYMDDLEKGLTSFISKFADDTKLAYGINSEQDRRHLQEDLNKLIQWTQKWQMNFNTEKCSVLHFGYNNPHGQYRINNEILESKEEEKDLGVYISTSMKASRHCAEVVKKANKTMGIIRRNFKNLNRKVIVKLYKSLVRPHVDYCVQVWKPYFKKDIDLIEGVQRRMTKMIPALRSYDYPTRLTELHLTTLQERHTRQDLITVYNMFDGKINLAPERFFTLDDSCRTRGNSKKIKPRYTRLEVRRNTFFERVWKEWNKLSEEVVSSPTLLAFKEHIDQKGPSRAEASCP